VHGRPDSLRRAKDLIDTRYDEPLDVPALARAALLSRAHFSRIFRRTFGLSPHQYLIARRMERATVLLRTTDRPVKEICRTVGLRSVGSFTTRFSRTFGMAPTVYRAIHRAPPLASEFRRAS
jgi:AraC-like DNA-binding protein